MISYDILYVLYYLDNYSHLGELEINWDEM